MIQFESEILYSQYLKERISKYFNIIEECQGRHDFIESNLIIDFLCFPKKKTIKSGFNKVYFGIEVKCPTLKNRGMIEPRSPSGVIAQCLDYMCSKFEVSGKWVALDACFVFPGFEYFDCRCEIEHLMSMLNHHKIGNIDCDGDSLRFNLSEVYWDSKCVETL